MNERIKELAEQATEPPRFPANIGYFNKEKFAELIVRETLKEVRDEVQYEYDWKLADAVTERVLTHFGVEE